MIIEKKVLEKNLEAYREKIGKYIPVLEKDISDVMLFLAIYCGNERALSSEILIKMDGFNEPKIETEFNKDGTEKKVKTNKEKGCFIEIKSYDKTTVLNLIFSKKYIKIQKTFDTSSDLYISEYIFQQNGHFIRNVVQKSHPLGNELEFKEKSEGNLKRGVCFSLITEKRQKMKTEFFKIQTSKGEEIYYSYFAEPDLIFFYRAPKTCLIIPSITSIGMKSLNEVLENQFSKDYVKLGGKIFKELEKSAREIFNEQLKTP